MSEEIIKTNGGEKDANTQPDKARSQSVDIYRPKPWVPIVFVSSLLSVAVGGVWFILWASHTFTDPAARLTFIMGSLISLFLLLSTVATTCIYWGQRNIMLQQWKSMNENIARTDVIISKMGQQQAAMEWQAGIAEIQTSLVDEQVHAMKGQLEAMREQLGVMEKQETAMHKTVELTEQGLRVSNRSYVGIHSLEAELRQERLILLIENTGNIPAKDVKVDGTVSALIMDVAAGEGSMLRRLRPDIASRRFHKEFPRLFQGNLKGRMVIDLDLIAARGGHYLSGIAEGRGILVVEGRIEYSDGFEDGLITRFAFNYDRDSGWTVRPIEEVAEARDSTENQ